MVPTRIPMTIPTPAQTMVFNSGPLPDPTLGSCRYPGLVWSIAFFQIVSAISTSPFPSFQGSDVLDTHH
jgi:hypothetical protein